jgi:Trypsin-co-occurring domain 2
MAERTDATGSLEVPLAEAIGRLRDELMSAAAAGAGEDVRFRLGPITLDLEVTATYSGGGQAGINWYLVSFGAKGEASTSRAHTIHLELQPVGADGTDLLVGGRAAREPG